VGFVFEVKTGFLFAAGAMTTVPANYFLCSSDISTDEFVFADLKHIKIA